jgi:hypothetical protein
MSRTAPNPVLKGCSASENMEQEDKEYYDEKWRRFFSNRGSERFEAALFFLRSRAW